MNKPQPPRSRQGAASARSERASRERGTSRDTTPGSSDRDGRLFFSRSRRDVESPAADERRPAVRRDERAPSRESHPERAQNERRAPSRAGHSGSSEASRSGRKDYSERNDERFRPRESSESFRGDARGQSGRAPANRQPASSNAYAGYREASPRDGRHREAGYRGEEGASHQRNSRDDYGQSDRGASRANRETPAFRETRRDDSPRRDRGPSEEHAPRGPWRGDQERKPVHSNRPFSQPMGEFHPRMPIAAVRIEQVQRVLGEVLQWTFPADATLSHWLRAHRELGIRDRAEIAEAMYDVLRHLRRYRQLGESGTGPAARRLAILGLHATLGLEALSPGLNEQEAQWLERVSSIDLATLPRAIRFSMPDWLDERLASLENPEALADALNRQASLDIRVNPLKAERDAMLEELNAGSNARFELKATPHSPWGMRVAGRPSVNRWPQFEDGRIEVQDEGSQLLALLVGPRRGEMIVDFCAGAGGKTLLLGALMRSTGRLYAFDVSAARLARAKPRFARSGLSNVVPVVIDSENDARIKRLAGKAQRVLVDAPCSGIGTLRRNPDLKWRQHPEALVELGALQTRILHNASRCVAPGGRLVYATCSLLPEEIEVQAQRFLETHPDFELIDAAALLTSRCETLALTGPYAQLRPDLHGTDGFFAAVFERKKHAAAKNVETEIVQSED